MIPSCETYNCQCERCENWHKDCCDTHKIECPQMGRLQEPCENFKDKNGGIKMTGYEYQEKAMRTANNLSRSDLILNGVMGLNGEAGECIDIVKKHLCRKIAETLSKRI